MVLMKTALSVKALSQHNAFVKSMFTYHYQVHLSNINHPMKHVGRLFKFKHITSIKYSLGWSAFIFSFVVRIPLAIIS